MYILMQNAGEVKAGGEMLHPITISKARSKHNPTARRNETSDGVYRCLYSSMMISRECSQLDSGIQQYTPSTQILYHFSLFLCFFSAYTVNR